MNKDRLEGFSDGVIAVSLTLMLYQLEVPADFTLNGLWQEAPTFFGYVLSFIYVGIYWSNHQAATSIWLAGTRCQLAALHLRRLGQYAPAPATGAVVGSARPSSRSPRSALPHTAAAQASPTGPIKSRLVGAHRVYDREPRPAPNAADAQYGTIP